MIGCLVQMCTTRSWNDWVLNTNMYTMSWTDWVLSMNVYNYELE